MIRYATYTDGLTDPPLTGDEEVYIVNPATITSQKTTTAAIAALAVAAAPTFGALGDVDQASASPGYYFTKVADGGEAFSFAPLPAQTPATAEALGDVDQSTQAPGKVLTLTPSGAYALSWQTPPAPTPAAAGNLTDVDQSTQAAGSVLTLTPSNGKAVSWAALPAPTVVAPFTNAVLHLVFTAAANVSWWIDDGADGGAATYYTQHGTTGAIANSGTSAAPNVFNAAVNASIYVVLYYTPATATLSVNFYTAVPTASQLAAAVQTGTLPLYGSKAPLQGTPGTPVAFVLSLGKQTVV